MPKIVDHEQRRTEIAEALWRVVARQGLEGATIRAVAAEAGWSRGIVEHYFDNKEELLAFSCRLAVDRALAQARLRHETLAGREALRAVLLDCVADAQDIWFDLLGSATRESSLAAELVRFDAEMSKAIGEIIVEMISRGEASSDRDPAAEARAVFAFNISLKVESHLQPGPLGRELVESRVDGFLDRLTWSPQGGSGAATSPAGRV